VTTFQEILDFIEPEHVGKYWFRGKSVTPQQRIFGGQVLAQCLMAANQTVEQSMLAHSMHAYFLRAGDPNAPIEFEVDPIRNGRSFTTRRVVARQHEQAIFNTSISYQIYESGVEHCAKMPNVTLKPFDGTQPKRADGKERWPLLTRYGVERMLGEHGPDAASTVSQNNWYRVMGSMGDDQRQHQAGLALISDFSLLSTTVLAHNTTDFEKEYMFASLDHAIWFHAPINLNDPILYYCDSPWSGNARGFNRGQFWSRDGTLLASTTQEGLMRKRAH